jgi:hypothetical protein
MRRRTASLLLLNCGAGLMVLGGIGDLLMRSPPELWSSILGQPVASLSPGVQQLLMALLHALGGALIACGIAALFLINGPLRRGERWTRHIIAVLALFSEGMNAFQIFRTGASYYWVPFTFAALILAGLLLASVPSFVFPAQANPQSSIQ